MSKKIFISYCHRQSDWVWQRLVPCLKAGGAEVLIDVERFKAGVGVIGQMDAAQDQADASLLVLTPEYLTRTDCIHEMQRAIARDPNFTAASTIPLFREACDLPEAFKIPKPLWVNLTNDKDSAKWDMLFKACEADLGADVPHWLEVRDDLLRALRDGQSVNLVVLEHPRLKEMIEQISDMLGAPKLGQVNLYSRQTSSRPDLVKAILAECGMKMPEPDSSDDLRALETAILSRSLSRIALLHMDVITNRRSEYDKDLFSSLRYLAEERKLVMLAQSRQPLITLLPSDHPLSSFIPNVVELHGRKRQVT